MKLDIVLGGLKDYAITQDSTQKRKNAKAQKMENELSGHEGKDHYHGYNPNTTGRMDQYMDVKGNPCPRGSNESHLYPEA